MFVRRDKREMKLVGVVERGITGGIFKKYMVAEKNGDYYKNIRPDSNEEYISSEALLNKGTKEEKGTLFATEVFSENFFENVNDRKTVTKRDIKKGLERIINIDECMSDEDLEWFGIEKSRVLRIRYDKYKNNY